MSEFRIVRLAPEDPSTVRTREGFAKTGTWYSPLRQRPAAFKRQHGKPSDGVRESGVSQ